MITGTNKSTEATEFVAKKYIGVASINILAINPNNTTLRKYGWKMPEDAEEPKYVIEKVVNGRTITNTRVRFLVQVTDHEDQPVIPLDFWISKDYACDKDKTKYQIIDEYGRSAWATQETIKAKEIPVSKNGTPMSIATPYHLARRGEAELIAFLCAYMNLTPFARYDFDTKTYVPNSNPGKIAIDNWDALCKGNVKELASYIAMLPDQKCKVCLGVKIVNNAEYQTFLTGKYLPNHRAANRLTGTYKDFEYQINYQKERNGDAVQFSNAKVKTWTIEASEVKDNAMAEFNPTSASPDAAPNLDFDADDLPS